MSTFLCLNLAKANIALQDNGLELGEMSADDLPEVLAIEQSVAISPWSPDQIKNAMADTVVLREKQSVIGFAVLVLVADQAELHNIAIHPERQGQGLAGIFLRWLIQSAPPVIEAFYLEVRVTNYRALRLYQGLGFAEIGRRSNYYSNNQGREDAVIMGRARNFVNG